MVTYYAKMIHRKNMNGLFFNANVTAAAKRFFLPALFHTDWITKILCSLMVNMASCFPKYLNTILMLILKRKTMMDFHSFCLEFLAERRMWSWGHFLWSVDSSKMLREISTVKYFPVILQKKSLNSTILFLKKLKFFS